ncbi:hypothetical protein NFIA_012520 [Paecilomyces variotii No. 5]|uniref:Thioesterase-like superfamily-domain-containing protein n=1 Tax=Byssochlamys spectabilis (strain No. 5 / NBRC 109023) TaxID=1356009 RepID=V5FYE9_BYSSN|nr:hypothetical protein NFIA_012520 [Paecilomyces variotii No. 5]
MSEPCHSSFFEKAISVVPINSNTYSAQLDPAWCIGKESIICLSTVPHGGYTTSILYRTVAAYFAHKNSTKKRWSRTPEPIGLQISFLRRTFAGPAILTVQDVKLGQRVSTIHVSLSQKRENSNATKGLGDADELEVKVVAYITVSPPDMEEGPVVKGTWNLSPPWPHGSLPGGLVDFKKLTENNRDGDWVRSRRPPPVLTAAKHLEIYSPSSTLLPRTLEEQTKEVVDQWARFTPNGKPAKWSNEAVMYVADMFPEALGRMGAMETSRLLAIEGEGNAKGTAQAEKGPFWYPSVTMNIDLKNRIPPQGVEWLHSRVVTRMIRGGRADLDVVILDENRELVATSSQVALVVDASRNTKGRQDPGKL